MSLELFITEHLDLWTEAVTKKSTSGRGSNGKIELTGIQKLRELILELAVRGKLTEQHSSDGSASQLIQQIDANFNGSGKSKSKSKSKSKRAKPKALSLTDQPYAIPSTWIWVRLGMLGQIIGGGTPKSKEPTFWTNDGIKWLTPADLYGLTKKTVESGRRDITQEGLERSSARLLPAQSVLFSSRAPIGYVAINTVELATNQGFKSCVPHIDGLTDYLYYFLKRSAKHVDAQASGTTFKEISGSKFAEWPIALPPLAEQHRIVQKVDELMALCDRLEQQTRDQHAAHETLVDALLDTLTQSQDAEELADNWARLAAHFDTLFTTEDSIDRLKQTILRLGVTGRLMTQDSSDECASVLLSKIAAEKKRLVSDGRINKPKKSLPVSDAEKTFEIPEGWAWSRFQDFADEVSTGPFGSMVHKSDYMTGGVPLINPSHMISGVIREDASVSVSNEKATTLSSYALAENDIVMARRGEVGRCALVNEREDGWLCGTGSFVLRFHEQVDRYFVLNLFLTQEIRKYLSGNSVGTTMTNLNHGILNKLPVAVPPSSEQKRIVKEIERLVAVCDHLKVRLNQASETRRQLASAVVEQAIY